MTAPRYYLKDETFLFEVAECVETRKTYILKLRGLQGARVVRKNDPGLYMRKPFGFRK